MSQTMQEFLEAEGVRQPTITPQEQPSFGDEAIDFGRTLVGQGALLGFGDELEAKVKTLWDAIPYDEIVKEIRTELKSFEERNPGTAITAEILGSIAPTALMLMSGVGTGGAAANTARVGSKMLSMGSKFKVAAPIAMAESAAYEVGKGEEGIAEDIYRAPEGALWGLGGTAVATPIMHGAQIGFDKIASAVRTKFGDRASGVVVKQLKDLVKETGKSVGEIITDIQAGRLFAENKTLAHAISSIFGEGGEVKSFLTKEMGDRAMETRVDLRDTMSRSALDVEGDKAVESAYSTFRQGQEGTQEGMSEAYKQAWKGAEELQPDMISDLMEALNRVPDGQTVLETINKSRGNVVPYFKFDESGTLIMHKKPTLEDAEEVYRTIRDHKTGVSTADAILGNVANDLKAKLNKISPQLREARIGFRVLKTNEDAFNAGSRGFTNPDETVYQFNKILDETTSKDSETAQIALEKLKAFRAGIMNGLGNKLRKGGGAGQVAGDEDMAIPFIIRTVFPDQDIDTIIKKADIAETAQTMKNKVTAGGTGGGSDTSGRGLSQARREGQGIAQGDSPTRVAITRMIDFAIDKIAPKMDDKGRMEVAKILYSKNPDVVKKALTGKGEIGAELQQQINDIITSIGYFAMPGAVATQPQEGILDQFNLAQ